MTSGVVVHENPVGRRVTQSVRQWKNVLSQNINIAIGIHVIPLDMKFSSAIHPYCRPNEQSSASLIHRQRQITRNFVTRLHPNSQTAIAPSEADRRFVTPDDSTPLRTPVTMLHGPFEPQALVVGGQFDPRRSLTAFEELTSKTPSHRQGRNRRILK